VWYLGAYLVSLGLKAISLFYPTSSSAAQRNPGPEFVVGSPMGGFSYRRAGIDNDRLTIFVKQLDCGFLLSRYLMTDWSSSIGVTKTKSVARWQNSRTKSEPTYYRPTDGVEVQPYYLIEAVVYIE